VIITGPATAFLNRLRRLRRRASVDALTAVLNRGSFDEHADRLSPADRRRPRAFIMADVDGLKAVNDRFGHAAGDRVLQRLGQVLLAHTRRADVVGRVGGDEFAILCPGADRAHARALVRRLHGALRADNALHPDEPRLSAQFGLAWSAAGRPSVLRRRADRQLYRLKRAAARL
jgi:diguanylate cyclase (GGDEF)-like protein